MHTQDSGTNKTDGAAGVSFPQMSQAKWHLIRLFETLMQCIKPLMPPLPRKENPDEPPATILVVECWNLGDLAILVPFLKNLRRAFPNSKISLLAKAGLESFLDVRRIVHEFIPVRVPWACHFHRWGKYNPFSPDWITLMRTLLALRRQRFDWALSGRMDVRDNFLLWLSAARRRIGYCIGGGACFLTDCVPPDLSRPHRADVWLHLLESMGVSVDRRLGHLHLTDSDVASAHSHLIGLGIPPDAFLIGVHPGARIPTRRWGEDRYAEIARRLLKETDAHILWFSEPGSSTHMPHLERCHSVSLDLQRFLALLSQCRLLVCNDSGPMHLANLLNVPVVAIFGPQRPEWFGPRGARDQVVIRPEFPCRPCFDYCIFDKPHCLATISVDEVYGAVTQAFRQLRFT